mmetsp:Transcript_38337/g.121018  ORF Transcript_38337/g.121018 Transcript_38337/m.121018 type:complete len:331 (-) Transcript_38337:1729-2721(-)
MSASAWPGTGTASRRGAVARATATTSLWWGMPTTSCSPRSLTTCPLSTGARRRTGARAGCSKAARAPSSGARRRSTIAPSPHSPSRPRPHPPPGTATRSRRRGSGPPSPPSTSRSRCWQGIRRSRPGRTISQRPSRRPRRPRQRGSCPPCAFAGSSSSRGRAARSRTRCGRGRPCRLRAPPPPPAPPPSGPTPPARALPRPRPRGDPGPPRHPARWSRRGSRGTSAPRTSTGWSARVVLKARPCSSSPTGARMPWATTMTRWTMPMLNSSRAWMMRWIAAWAPRSSTRCFPSATLCPRPCCCTTSRGPTGSSPRGRKRTCRSRSRWISSR